MNKELTKEQIEATKKPVGMWHSIAFGITDLMGGGLWRIGWCLPDVLLYNFL